MLCPLPIDLGFSVYKWIQTEIWGWNSPIWGSNQRLNTYVRAERGIGGQGGQLLRGAR